MDLLPRVPSLKLRAAEERMWRLAAHARERAGWLATDAHIVRRWVLRRGKDRVAIDIHVSFFFEGFRGPAVVFNLAFAPLAAKGETEARAAHDPWFEGLRGRLGSHYRVDEYREERPALVRVLRGTSDPKRILRELDVLTAAVEGKPLRRTNTRARYKQQKTIERRARDLWTVLDALRAGPWTRRSVHQQLTRRIRHDGRIWLDIAVLQTFVTDKGPPRFYGSLFGASRGAARSPMLAARKLLADAGYRRRAAQFIVLEPRNGTIATVTREIARLEQAMALVGSRR